MAHNSASLDFRRAYWLRQLSDCAEANFQSVLETLKTYVGGPITLAAKCYDGNTPQGQIDPKTPLNSLDDMKALQTLCWNDGIGFVPVVVPRGEDGEENTHAQLANAIGAIVVDIEIGPGFYDGKPAANIPSYFQTLRTADALIVSQPDPRNLESVYTAECVQYLDAFAPQHYVGWTQVGWNDVVLEVQRFDQIRAYGKEMYPTLYGVGDQPTVGTFWRAVKDYSYGIQFFRFGVMDEQELQFSRSLLLPGEAING